MTVLMKPVSTTLLVSIFVLIQRHFLRQSDFLDFVLIDCVISLVVNRTGDFHTEIRLSLQLWQLWYMKSVFCWLETFVLYCIHCCLYKSKSGHFIKIVIYADHQLWLCCAWPFDLPPGNWRSISPLSGQRAAFIDDIALNQVQSWRSWCEHSKDRADRRRVWIAPLSLLPVVFCFRHMFDFHRRWNSYFGLSILSGLVFHDFLFADFQYVSGLLTLIYEMHLFYSIAATGSLWHISATFDWYCASTAVRTPRYSLLFVFAGGYFELSDDHCC
jgi:hypothetical protein